MRGSSHKPTDKTSRFTRIVGILASALVLWLLAAQVTPGLHRLACGHVHPGATFPAHTCVITDFSQGQGHAQPTPVFVAPVPVETGRVAPSQPLTPGVNEAHRLPPACGPPGKN
ncbi:hypothetical protein Ga0100231_019550 [Opitutaceae bacterium TAV4]|nr:hypothetical protein Ga0100231_019550 [Opitutaceae bacterium TAV4]RRK00273.1 hypothetical protein Ga0100230_020290 [Opitutaceae bacterium TAV3]